MAISVDPPEASRNLAQQAGYTFPLLSDQNGEAIRSCVTPMRGVAGMEITTIEGLTKDGLHPVQKAWIHFNVPQCGYCQSGQIMQAVALLNHTPQPSDQEIDEAMAGNICRCGTYQRIRAAIKAAAEESA